MQSIQTSASTLLQNSAASRAPILRIHRPPLRRQTLPYLEKVALAYAFHEKALADRTGAAPAVAVLFNECALSYRFNISSGEVMLAVEKISKQLPKDFPFMVAFSVMEQADQFNTWNVPSNTGYLFSSDSIYFSPKRRCTEGDMRELANANKSYHNFTWNSRTRGLEDQRVPFPSIQLDGFSIEHRICADVQSPPLWEKKRTITLVSAWDLPLEYTERISSLRPLVVINDYYGYSTSGRVLRGNKSVSVFLEGGKYCFKEKDSNRSINNLVLPPIS